MALVDVSASLGARGQPRMKAICDSCQREEVIPCQSKEAGQARKKLQEMGWRVVGKAEHCPACAAKERAAKLKKQPEKAGHKQELRKPTRAQRREIVGLLEVSYDVEKECYTGNETDETLAKVLGVMPGWVAEIREEFFGADGGNQELSALIDDFSTLTKAVVGFGDEASNLMSQFNKALDEMSKLGKRLDQVQKAVGPRGMARAGK